MGDGAQYIAGVALRRPNGKLFAMERPARHSDVLGLMQNLGYPSAVARVCEQGFVDQRGRWLTRAQALRVARYAGQLLDQRKMGRGHRELYSEDVW